MPPPPLSHRVAILEEKVNTFVDLPSRVGAVETQLIAVRHDLTGLRNELTDLRNDLTDLRSDVTELRTDLTSLRDDFESFRVEVRTEFVSVRAEAAAMEGRLRVEIRAGDEETRRQMRVLHEEVISRIALLQEGLRRNNP